MISLTLLLFCAANILRCCVRPNIENLTVESFIGQRPRVAMHFQRLATNPFGAVLLTLTSLSILVWTLLLATPMFAIAYIWVTEFPSATGIAQLPLLAICIIWTTLAVSTLGVLIEANQLVTRKITMRHTAPIEYRIGILLIGVLFTSLCVIDPKLTYLWGMFVCLALW